MYSNYPAKLAELTTRHFHGTEDMHARQILENGVREIFPDLSFQEQLAIADSLEAEALVAKIKLSFSNISDDEAKELAKAIMETLRNAEQGDSLSPKL